MSTIQPFTISRIFNAPRELVFKANTEPEHLAKWYGPEGTTVIKAEMDLRPGGIHHYGLRTPDGQEMWGKQVYREIVAPEKLVFVQSFSDKDGGVTRHPMAATWPLEMLATTTFEDLGDGRTKMSITWMPINASDEENKTFDGAREGMVGGFKGTFEKLDAYLASVSR
ncbi:MAG: SRPBCC domain-containing protein [candidate division FCPU426 bacterium]